MLRVLVPLCFQALSTRTGNSTRHARDMEATRNFRKAVGGCNCTSKAALTGVQRWRGLLIGNCLMGGADAVQVCNTATPGRRLWSGVIAHRNSKYDGEPLSTDRQLRNYEASFCSLEEASFRSLEEASFRSLEDESRLGGFWLRSS